MKDEDSATGTLEHLGTDTTSDGKTALTTRIKTYDEAVRSSESIRQGITHNPRKSILAMLRFDPDRLAALMTGIAE
ncbi:MAG: hypothetical protein HQL03_03345 [Nitrospirae bacterium]|nr:hypothetical protein [Nitrospirota bacterium]MBF0590778.1 hypothetical protein [Nitrospirota bacterium]